MSVVVITPPEPWVSLALAKQHCRIDDDDSDTLLQIYIAAACGEVDGPGGWLERAIGVQTLELRLDGFYADDWRVGAAYAWDAGWSAPWPFARRIRLPFPPFVSVTSITYEDGSGVDQVLTPTGWQASDEGVEPSFGASWPSGRVAANAVRIRYQAGYPDSAEGKSTIPAGLVAGTLLIIGSLWENRQADVIDARAVVAQNPAVERQLQRFRVWA